MCVCVCTHRRVTGYVSLWLRQFAVSSFQEAVSVRTRINCGSMEILKSVPKSRSIIWSVIKSPVQCGLNWGAVLSSAAGLSDACDVYVSVAQRLRRQWWWRFLAVSPDGSFPLAPCPAARTPAAPPHLQQTRVDQSKYVNYIRRVRYGTNHRKINSICALD